jgi:hypothetical protein
MYQLGKPAGPIIITQDILFACCLHEDNESDDEAHECDVALREEGFVGLVDVGEKRTEGDDVGGRKRRKRLVVVVVVVVGCWSSSRRSASTRCSKILGGGREGIDIEVEVVVVVVVIGLCEVGVPGWRGARRRSRGW